MRMEVLHITELPSYLEENPTLIKQKTFTKSKPVFLSDPETIHKPSGISQVSSRNSHISEKLNGNKIWGELGAMTQMRKSFLCG